MIMILPTSKHTKGFTLVEIMISMAISLILLLGVMQIFNSNKRSSRVSEGLARVQENARFAIKKITADMRRAGYVGCAGISNIDNHLEITHGNYDADLFDISKSTSGWEYTRGLATSATQPGETYVNSNLAPASADGADARWKNNTAQDLPASLSGQVVPGSDIVVLKWAGAPLNIDLANPATVSSNFLDTVADHGIADGALLVISDCSGADVFQHVSSGDTKQLTSDVAAGLITPGNVVGAPNFWGHAYPTPSSISPFLSKAYYVGTGVSGEPSLFRISYVQAAAGQTTEEIAEGIENMQVLYGIDADADFLPEKYVTAEQVADHSFVVALKIALIARSPSEIKSAPSSRSINLLGTTITTPSDRYLRFVFTTTVKLRNRGAK